MMRISILVALTTLCLASLPTMARATSNTQNEPQHDTTILPDDSNGDVSPSEDSGLSSKDEDSRQPDSGSTTTSAPSRRSLLDLKSAQDKAEQSGEVIPDARTSSTTGFCNSRDIAGSVKMPNKKVFMRIDGADKAKFEKCKSSFEDLEDACDPEEGSCAECDKAVKVYSIACGYGRPADN